MGRRFARAALGAVPALLAGLWLGAQAGPARAQDVPQCRADRVIVKQADRLSQFLVEIADTEGERAQGLMGRESLPKSAGMLFVYPDAREVSFWMHNTPLPLDILYIDAAGRVAKIAREAKPFDETPLPSGAPVQYVLEINGGLSDLLGLSEGAVVAYPGIDQAGAAFPCP
ncbi:hypothetical protein DL1_05045 [Thioclava dalianensis]|uniref:Uncharacterized protein n=1 Tax=Thioclava dalianensis TaxID=1185766 RepID=A0A074TBY5_9RHOB|nr:DUF192 domain-containing protein [Thioclava dalianensis]KEP69256.1 hypothetical protein DL1_05045 [Thioclava dalianensis]SFM73172.1 hypothetical protein SAMN05216224_10157 [Thioclava dalianensis]